MRWDEWLAADVDRRPATTHVRLGDGWAEEGPATAWSVRWVPGTGEVVACPSGGGDVERLGYLGGREEVEDALDGWEEAMPREGSLYWARSAVTAVAQLRAPPPEPVAAERYQGARYRLNEPDGSWWEVGWDRPLATYYAQHRIDDEPLDVPRVAEWHGTDWEELAAVDELEAAVGRPLGPQVRAELAADAEAFPAHARPPFVLRRLAELDGDEVLDPGPGYEAWLAAEPLRRVQWDYGLAWRGEDLEESYRLSWVPESGELFLVDAAERGRVEVIGRFADQADVDRALGGWRDHVLQPGGLYWLRDAAGRAREAEQAFEQAFEQEITGTDLRSWTAELDARSTGLDLLEGDLERRERRLDARERALRAALDVEPRWGLPVAPVAELLAGVEAGTGDDLATVARGIGLEPAWAASVVAGEVGEVDLPHVAQVCEGLRCSPYDLWGEDDAAGILHAYPPSLWPRFIEPLQPPDLGIEPPGPELPGPGPELGL